MIIHNVCFCGDIRKIVTLFGRKSVFSGVTELQVQETEIFCPEN